MAIKNFETRANLKEKLRKRGLLFDDNELDEALIKYNYFNLFNGFESLLLSSSNPKKFDKVNLKDFIALYEFDKLFTSALFRHLNNIEEKLKSSISHHFSAKYCNSLNDTMQYTNKDNYMNPQEKNINHINFCKYSSNYPFVNNQNRSIYYEFNAFSLFSPFFLTNLINSNDYIDKTFYTDSNYSAPNKVAKYKDNSIYTDIAVPFWVAINTLTFGEIIRLLHYLKDDVMKEVLNDFNLKLSKRFDFLNMLDFLLCLRNNCAHGFLINRFRTPKKYKINSLLEKTFNLSPRSKGSGSPSSILNLFDVIKILSYFEEISSLKKLLNKILFRNYMFMGIKRGKNLNKKLLGRMGSSSYSNWRKILSKKVKYIL
ncbi:Abi family protein [Fusobacterium polymorphum]|uniref:Abi family protein n=1 Tax=Fusobacterium nucleatum subsp. polymorphum TaxID=76857 RepID=UPI00300BE5A5